MIVYLYRFEVGYCFQSKGSCVMSNFKSKRSCEKEKNLSSYTYV